MTGQILIDLFTTLDGVAQAPGGPDEDTSDGFRFGGWQAGVPSGAVGQSVMDGMAELDALLLGRRTYDIFAGYWPQHTTGSEGTIGRLFNKVPKYVASRDEHIQLGWEGSTQVGTDLAAEVTDLRERHRQVHVIGSIDLVQTLFAERLFDELRLWVHPIVLGHGKRVFGEGAQPANLELLQPATTGDHGTLLLRYGPGAPGEPTTGTVGS